MAEIKFQIKQATDYKENCEAMRQHIIKNEFKRDDIVSITSCVKSIQDDDHVLAFFYRTQSNNGQSIPVDQLQVDIGKSSDEWDDQFAYLENHSAQNEIVAVGNTPMKGLNTQTIWSLPVGKSGQAYNQKVDVKVLFKQDGDYKDLVQKGKEWLDTHIMPHQLISVSLFEDEHDIETRESYLCIAHTAGDEPKPISELMPEYHLPAGGLFKVQTFAHEGNWAYVFEQAKKYMNNFGAEEGHLVSAANFSFEQQGCVAVVYSWTNDHANSLKDSRNEACCAECTIF